MSPFERQEVISAFLQEANICNQKLGKKIEDCESLKASFNKEIGSPTGCSSCRKRAVYQKYRQIISAKLLKK